MKGVGEVKKQPSSYCGFKYVGGQGAVPTNVSPIPMGCAIRRPSDFHIGACTSETICNHPLTLFDGIL